MEVLGYLPPNRRASYWNLVDALQRRLGHHHLTEVYRVHLKKHARERQLMQDVESLVRRSYPAAPKE